MAADMSNICYCSIRVSDEDKDDPIFMEKACQMVEKRLFEKFPNALPETFKWQYSRLIDTLDWGVTLFADKGHTND